jgi:hypothetical protein
MKTLMALLFAGGLALGLVALLPAPAEAGRGWHGGHWHGGGWRGAHWRGGRNWHGRRYAWRGGTRWRGGWGWGWGPGVNVYVGGRRCWDPVWGRVPCRWNRWGY